jgi:hypothetical protein
MTVLSIAQRELRVAARKRSTFWTRLIAAALTLAIASLLLVTFNTGAGFVPNPGKVIFLVLSWAAFIYALVAGVFLASDSLSEEKREGTLGLLFLTDLRGYDIVLGKLAATSLHAAYGLVAAFPILALSLLLGGLLAEEFWKGILAIANMLFFSLAVGIFASCVSREPLRAMNTAIMFLVFLIGLPYLIDFGLADWHSVASVTFARLVTPFHPFLSIQSGGTGYWFSLLISHLIAWVCLALAAVRAPYCWQETRLERAKPAAELNRRRHRQTGKRSSDPLLWLASRRRHFRFWILAALLIAIALIGLSAYSWRTLRGLSQFVLTVAGLLLYVWMTAHATRFFFEGVRSGALELILCTPIATREVIRAQWMSFMATFTLPLLFIVTAEQLATFTQLLKTGAGTPIGSYMIAQQIYSAITSVTTGIAIGWFGMWMGLRSRKAHVAIIKTLVFVFVLPFIGLGLFQLILTFTFAFRGRMPDWLPPAASCVLWVIKDVIFIRWSRGRLYTRFRETVAGIETKRVRAADRVREYGPETSGEHKLQT